MVNMDKELNYQEEIEKLLKPEETEQEKQRKLIEKAMAMTSVMRKPSSLTYTVKDLKEDQTKKQIVDVNFASDGTVRTYIKGEVYPVRFFTPHDIIDVVSNYKRLFAQLLQNGFWGLISLYFNQRVWSLWLSRIFELYPIILKENHYSQPVKEIRRVLRDRIDGNIRDGISGVFQNDMAYCYRMQDILSELDKESFYRNPIKEIKRLIRLIAKRDKGSTVIQNYKKYINFVELLRFKPKLSKQLKEIVKDLDINEVKLSKEDIYWTNIVSNYNYRGIPYEERIKEYEAMKNG